MEVSKKVIVILVEPSGSLNLGSVARLCANFDVAELRLVSPQCDPSDQVAKIMAVHGRELLKKATKFPRLIDAISDCRKIVATCGRIDHGETPLHSIQEVVPWLMKGQDSSPIAIVFGREDRGLTNKELQLAQKVITLKTTKNYPSLNLSHAVAIVLHEFYYSNNKFNANNSNEDNLNLAFPNELNDCLKDAEELLLETGFLLEHTKHARISKIRALLQRGEIRSAEVAMIRGIVRQLRWSIHSK